MSNKKTMTEILSNRLTTALGNHSTYIEGKLLTYLDSIITDPVQRKAVKDTLSNLLLRGNDSIRYGMLDIVNEEIYYIYNALNPNRNETKPYYVNVDNRAVLVANPYEDADLTK